MNYNAFKSNWSGLIANTNTQKLVNLMLSIGLVFSLYMQLTREESIILLPPAFDERIKLSLNSADSGYLKSWAVYLADLAGNVHPGNVKFVADTIGNLLSTDAYHKIAGELGTQVFKVEKERKRTRFTPKDVTYEDATTKVFVRGDFESFSGDVSSDAVSAGSKVSVRKDKVYEFVIVMNNGRPMVKHFDTYFGPIRDKAYLMKMQALKEKGQDVK